MSKQVVRSISSQRTSEVDVNDKYNFLKQIGKGSYGEVWLVTPLRQTSSTKSNSKQYVLKRLDLRQQSNGTVQNDLEGAEREAKLLSTLKHPNIVAYIESFRSNDGFLNIVMAYCEGGDLYTKLKERKTNKQHLSENQIVEWFVQICMAIQYMHEKSILHRDLKTQNVFLTKNEIVKVGDLGIARVLDSGSDLATTIIGTPYYMSPEIFSNKPYGQKSDIWALGCCVYEMTTLEHAFNAKDMNSLVLKIIRGQIPQTSKKYSESLTDLIKSMLSKNPDDRPTAKQILQNAYIKQHIMRLLEKTKIKCQNQANFNSQVPIAASLPSSRYHSAPCAPTSSSMPPPSSSSSSLPPAAAISIPSPSSLSIPTPSSVSSLQVASSSTPALSSIPPGEPDSIAPSAVSCDVRRPCSSASSPSSKKFQVDRSTKSNAPILPSHPPLPPHHSRIPTNITASSSGSSASSGEIAPSSAPRARRRLRPRVNNSVISNEKKLDLSYLSKVSQNDTLKRMQRDQKLNNHLKQYVSASSDDEHDVSSQAMPSKPVVVVVPPKQSHKSTSATSSLESNHSKLSFDDDIEVDDHELNLQPREQQQQQSQSKITKSYDSNNNNNNNNNIQCSNPRARRRYNRLQSSIESSNQVVTNNDSQEISQPDPQDPVNAEIEKKKEGEKDMNDLVFMLTATLKLPPAAANGQNSDGDSNELTNSSNDSDRTIVNNGNSHSPSEEEGTRLWPMGNQTAEGELHRTNHMYKHHQALKEDCLSVISAEKLQRILKMIDNVSQTKLQVEMNKELGEYLCEKYASRIFLLKFYEDCLRTHT